MWSSSRRWQAKGKGTIAINTKHGNIKHINDHLYVLGLAHNLLSVGKLIENGYLVIFKNNECIMYDKENHNQIIAKINKLKNIFFTLNIFYEEENRALKVLYFLEPSTQHLILSKKLLRTHN